MGHKTQARIIRIWKHIKLSLNSNQIDYTIEFELQSNWESNGHLKVCEQFL